MQVEVRTQDPTRLRQSHGQAMQGTGYRGTSGIPKSGIPKTGIPKAEIPKLGIPKTGRFTAPFIQTPLRLPLKNTIKKPKLHFREGTKPLRSSTVPFSKG